MTRKKNLALSVAHYFLDFIPESVIPGQPCLFDLTLALENAEAVTHRLVLLKGIAARRSSSDKENMQHLAERVENALRSPYGALPEDILHQWINGRFHLLQYDKALYSYEEQAMLDEIYERWADKESLAKEFDGLRIYDANFLAYKEVPLEDAMALLEKWLSGQDRNYKSKYTYSLMARYTSGAETDSGQSHPPSFSSGIAVVYVGILLAFCISGLFMYTFMRLLASLLWGG